MKKYIRSGVCLLLICILVVVLLPMRGSSIKRRPESWMVDGRADYYQWDKATTMNDIPNDGQWHRMLLFFDYDEQETPTHMVNGDWQFYTYRYEAYAPYRFYRTPDVSGDAYIDTASSRFYTKDHHKGFFVKRVGYDPVYDNIQVKFRLCDDTGKMTDEFIGAIDSREILGGINIVETEDEATIFNMVSKDSKDNGDEVYEDRGTLLFFTAASPNWFLTYYDAYVKRDGPYTKDQSELKEVKDAFGMSL